MNVSIREVTKSDTEALWQSCWPDQALEVVTARILTCCRWMARTRAVGVVALADDAPIGFGQVVYWRERGEISDIIVANTHRNQGIGTSIIAVLIDKARQKRLSFVEIGVDEDNPRARALYTRLGFSDSTREIKDISGKRVSYLVMRLNSHV